MSTPAVPDTPVEQTPSMARKQNFLTAMFVVDTRTGQPEFSKILAFAAIIVLFVYQGYALFVMHAAFDPSAFAHSVAWMFGGLAAQLGVSEFFRQRFDLLNGIKRDGRGAEQPGGGGDVPPMMQPQVPDDTDNTPPASQ